MCLSFDLNTKKKHFELHVIKVRSVSISFVHLHIFLFVFTRRFVKRGFFFFKHCDFPQIPVYRDKLNCFNQLTNVKLKTFFFVKESSQNEQHNGRKEEERRKD